jgi:hypothetical protein
MKVLMCEQGTQPWLDARAGIATASEFNNILTPKRGTFASAWRGYAAQLIAERVIGGPDPWRSEWETADMRRGRAFESEARNFFSFTHGIEVQQVGFCIHDNGLWGASPDFLVGDWSGGELKCPAPKTQIDWVDAGKLPDDHKNQCHGGMIVTGRDHWHFLSYCEGCPALVVEVKRDDWTKRLEEALVKFDEKLAKMYANVMEKRMATIDAKISMKGSDQLDDSHRALVPPSGQWGNGDPDPFGAGEYEPQLF